jgi:ubiquinone/menaquinone biosynthesis C-methylase UbiE
MVSDMYKPTGLSGTISARMQSFKMRKVHQLVADRLDLRRRDVLLDVCCGNGQFIRNHAGNIKQVFGLDHSSRMIRQAVRSNTRLIREEGAEFARVKVEHLPWAYNSFTAITAVECMMYWTSPKAALQ